MRHACGEPNETELTAAHGLCYHSYLLPLLPLRYRYASKAMHIEPEYGTGDSLASWISVGSPHVHPKGV